MDEKRDADSIKASLDNIMSAHAQDAQSDQIDRLDYLVTAEDVISVLRMVDDDLATLGKKVEILIVGYAAIILSRRNSRGSGDIDIIAYDFSTVFHRQGLQIFDEHFFHLHPTFRDRTISLSDQSSHKFTYLKASYLDPHDIFLLKLDSYRSKDKTDLIYMLKNELVELPKLDKLFAEWNRYFFNDHAEIRARYEEVKRSYEL